MVLSYQKTLPAIYPWLSEQILACSKLTTGDKSDDVQTKSCMAILVSLVKLYRSKKQETYIYGAVLSVKLWMAFVAL